MSSKPCCPCRMRAHPEFDQRQNIPCRSLRWCGKKKTTASLSREEIIATFASMPTNLIATWPFRYAAGQRKMSIPFTVPVQRAGPHALVAQSGGSSSGHIESVPHSPGAKEVQARCFYNVKVPWEKGSCATRAARTTLQFY